MGLTGTNLTLAIHAATTERPALIEDFLYEGDVLMLAGEPGVGKSILSIQLACSVTLGVPVFDVLLVPVPRSVYYVQLEGRPEQSFERILRMSPKVSWDSERLYWDYRRGLNLLDLLQGEALLKDIRAWGTSPDLLVIDPLYQTVFGEMARELPAKAIIRFLDHLRALFKTCGVILVHHTKRPFYARDTGRPVEEDDSYFGSQWLKAYIDTSFLLKPGQGKYAREQVMLVCKKSRGADVVKDLILHYDPETDTVSGEAPFEDQSGYERVSKFLARCKQEGKTTNFFEVMEACKLSIRHLRYIQIAQIKSGKLRCDKSQDKKKIWEPL